VASDTTLAVQLTARTSELKSGMEVASEAVAAACAKMTEALEKFGRSGTREPKKVEESVSGLPRVFHAANEAAEGLEATLKSFGEIAIIGFIFEAVNKLREMAEAAIHGGVELEQMSQRTGVAVDELAGLQQVTALAGVSMEGFERAMRQMALKLTQAENGSKTAVGAFSELHLSLAKLKALNPEEQFYAMADAVGAMKDGTEKAGAVANLLGARVGTQLIPAMDQGSGTIRRLVADFRLLGTTTDQQAHTFDADHVALSTVKVAAESLGRSIVSVISPAIQGWGESMTVNIFAVETLGELVGDLASWLYTKLQPAIGAVERILHPFTAAIKEAGNAISSAFGDAVRTGGGGAALDDIEKRFTEFQNKIKAAHDIGSVSALFGGENQGEGGIGAGYNSDAAKALKDRFEAFSDEQHLEEAEKDKDVAFKITAERKIYNEAVKLFGATSTEARKQAVEVQRAVNEQIAETQRLRLGDLQQSQALSEKAVAGQVEQIRAQAAAQEESIRQSMRMHDSSAADTLAASLKAAQTETDALKAEAQVQYTNKVSSLNQQLAVLQEHGTLNSEAIKKTQSEILVAQQDYENQLAGIATKGSLAIQKINDEAAAKAVDAWKQTSNKITDNIQHMFDSILSATGKGQDRVSVLMKKWLLGLGKDAGFAALFGGAQGTLGGAAFGQKGLGGGAFGALTGAGGAGGIIGMLLGPSVAQRISGAITGNSGSGLVGMLFGSVGGFLSKTFGGGQGGGGNSAGQQAGGAAGGLAATMTATAAKELAAKIVQTTTLSGIFASSTMGAAATQAALLTAISLTLDEILSIDIANFAKPSIFGTTFAGGGIVPSAAGGMVVGKSNGNGIPSILHPKEMVLPAYLSEGFQNMLDKGDDPSSQTHVHFNVSAMDSRDVRRFFKDHADTIISTIQRGARGISTPQ